MASSADLIKWGEDGTRIDVPRERFRGQCHAVSSVLADHLDGVPDSRLERKTLKGHEHVPDLLPRECLAVNDNERQANIAVWIPLDPANEAVSLG